MPGLNCYSCPGALGACPIGSFQAVVTSRDRSFSFYVVGFLLIFGGLLGRFVCGWLCPFGLVQDLVHKIPFPKKWKKLPGDKYLRWLKYLILVGFVILLPLTVLDVVGQGQPWFCKYICPITVFLKPMSYFSLFRIKVEEEKCVSCGKCSRVCPMNVEVPSNAKSKKHATECILCLKCVEECPKKALKL